MIKAIVFDWWGTLAYRPHVTHLLEKVTGKSHHEVLRAYEKTTCLKFWGNYERALDALFKELNIKDDRKLRKEIKRRLSAVKLYNDVKPVIKDLKKKYKIIMLSNGTNYGEKSLYKFRMNTKFHLILFSAKTKLLKPSKEAYNNMLKLAGLKKDEVIMIGNTYDDDVVAAEKVGIKAYLLDRQDKHPEVKNRLTNLEQIYRVLK